MNKHIGIRTLILGCFAVTAWSSTTTASIADSMAGFEAGSMAGSLYDSQSSNQQNSQASTKNNTHSENEQVSQAGSSNFSQGRSEAVGGPLTNSRPGYMAPSVSTNTMNPNGNTPGMTGSPSMSMPLPPPNAKFGGQGYNSPSARGIPVDPTEKPANASNNNTRSGGNRTTNVQISQTLPPPPPEATAKRTNHVPHIVTRTYRWTKRHR